MDSSLLLAAALAIGFAIYYFVSKNQRYWNDRNVLVLPSSFPMGHLAGMGKVPFIDVLKESYDKFVGRDLFCGFYFITSARVLALDLDFVKHVLIKDFHYFADRKAYFNEVDDPLSGHLFNMRGAKWRQMRQQLTPTFTSGKMKAMFGLVTKETKTLITATAKMSASEADIDIDIKDLLMRYIADVIASCAFGLESRALEMEDSELMRAADQIFAVDTVRFLFMSTFEGLSRRLRLPLFRKAGTDYFMAVIRNAMDARTESQRAGGSGGKRNDFLNLLIELKNHGRIVDDAESEDLGKITFNELAAQAFIFMLAGFETTSTTMQFCLGELAANPDLQDKARLEAQRILDKNNGEFTYESLNELEFLSRCINGELWQLFFLSFYSNSLFLLHREFAKVASSWGSGPEHVKGL